MAVPKCIRILLLVVAVTHGYFFSGTNWNQNARYDAIYSFVEPGTPDYLSFRIDRFIFDPVGLKNTGDYAFSGGHYYSNKPPGTTLLGIPVYWMLYHGQKLVGIDPVSPVSVRLNAYLLNFWISIAWSLFAIVGLYKILTKQMGWTDTEAFWSCFIYAFATWIFPFNGTLWAHPTAAAFVIIATYFLLEPGKKTAALAGASIAFATLLDYMSGIYVAIGALYLFSCSRKRLPYFILGGLPFAMTLLFYQKSCFGSYFSPSSAHAVAMFRKEGAFLNQFDEFRFSSLYGLLFSLHRGILGMMPIFLFTLLHLFRVWRNYRKSESTFKVLILFLPIVILAFYPWWDGGNSSGSRALIFSIPFWVLFLPKLSELSSFQRKLYFGLITFGVIHMGIISAVDPMLTPNVTTPFGPALYGRFIRQDFPQILFPPHAENALEFDQHEGTAFNLGMVLLKLRGFLSLLPIAGIWIVFIFYLFNSKLIGQWSEPRTSG